MPAKTRRAPDLKFTDSESYEPISQVFGYEQESAEDHKISNQSRQKANNKNSYRVLLAEDDKELRVLIARAFRKAGYEVVECPDGWSLIEKIDYQLFLTKKSRGIDIIVSDIRMPGPSGMEVLLDLGNIKGFPPMVLMTAFGDNKTHALAALLGVAAIFDKPFDLDELLAKVHEILNGKF